MSKKYWLCCGGRDPGRHIACVEVARGRAERCRFGTLEEHSAWMSHGQPRLHEQDSNSNQKQVAGTHYKDMGVQPWAVVDTWPLEQRIGYYRGGALKYIMRMGSKDESVQEIAKGQHYIEKLLEVLKASQPQSAASLHDAKR